MGRIDIGGIDMGSLKGVVDHGESLDRAKARLPQAPEPSVDLSTGIGPHSYPLFGLPATTLLPPEPAREQKPSC